MTCLSLAISIINGSRGRTEKPCTMPDQTSAFIGLKPRKFQHGDNSDRRDGGVEKLRFAGLGMQTACLVDMRVLAAERSGRRFGAHIGRLAINTT
jgi:hypothetical protein